MQTTLEVEVLKRKKKMVALSKYFGEKILEDMMMDMHENIEWPSKRTLCTKKQSPHFVANDVAKYIYQKLFSSSLLLSLVVLMVMAEASSQKEKLLKSIIFLYFQGRHSKVGVDYRY